MSWLWISHLGAGILGATLGAILMAILAVGASVDGPDEHEAGPGR